MKQWIKFYTEALHDRKMRKLNRYDKSVFYDLLLLAGQEDQDGLLPDIGDIALELDLKASEAQKTVSNLITAGLLSKDENDNLMITNFHKRQEANSTGYERVKRYRDNHKNVINDNAMITDDNVINDNGHDNANDTQMITVEKELRIKNKEIDINTLSNDSVYAPAKKSAKPKSEKQKFGSMQNVLLTPEEYAKLCERFPNADSKIESLSLAIASKGYKYKDHYATILNWARMDADKKPAPKQEPKKTYSFAEVGEMMERGEIVL